MKPKLLNLLLLVLVFSLFSSCEKPILSQDEEVVEKKSPNSLKGNLILRVSGFEVIPFEHPTREKLNVKDICTRLCFAVYDLYGNKVTYKNQKKDDSGFGSVGFDLKEGVYYIAAVAHSSSGNPTMSDPAKIKFANSDGFSDTFYFYSEVSVSAEKQEVDIVLKRAVSMFRLVTKDVVPSNMQSVTFNYTGGSGALNLATGFGADNSKQTVTFTIDKSQVGKTTQFEVYTFLHAVTDTIDVNVKALTPLSVRDVTLKVPMEHNKITVFTGNLFTDGNNDDSGSGNTDNPGGGNPGNTEATSYVFPIMVETDWDGIIEREF